MPRQGKYLYGVQRFTNKENRPPALEEYPLDLSLKGPYLFRFEDVGWRQASQRGERIWAARSKPGRTTLDFS